MKLPNVRRGFYGDALRLMLPMIAQNIITQSMQLADTFMIGVLGETELAAVTVANTPFFVVMLMCFGVQSGAGVLVSQYYGKGNTSEINRILGVGLYLSMAVTAVISLVSFFFPTEIMSVLTNNSDLIAPGGEYVRAVGFSYFFFSISGTYLIGIQRSIGNPKLPAIIYSVSGLLNVFLNWVLIFGKLGAPELGITGAAVATVISRAFEVVVIVIYASRDKLVPLNMKLVLRPGMVIFKDFIRYAVPVILNELLWSFGISAYAVIMGHMDNSTPILAAYTIAGNLEKLLSVAVMASGASAAVIIGREIGMGKREGIYNTGVALNILAAAVGGVTCVLSLLARFFLAKQVIFPVLGIGGEAQDIALFMLTVLSVLQPLRCLNMVDIVGVLRGGGDVKFALIADIAPMYLVCIPLVYITGLVAGWGIFAVYSIIVIDDVIKCVMNLMRIRSKKWINDVTRESVESA